MAAPSRSFPKGIVPGQQVRLRTADFSARGWHYEWRTVALVESRLRDRFRGGRVREYVLTLLAANGDWCGQRVIFTPNSKVEVRG